MCAYSSAQPLPSNISRSVGYCTHTSLSVQYKCSQVSSSRLGIQLIRYGTCTTSVGHAGHHSIATSGMFFLIHFSRTSHLDKARLKLPPFFLSFFTERRLFHSTWVLGKNSRQDRVPSYLFYTP